MSKTHRKNDGATLQSGPVLAGHSCITSSNSHGAMLEEIELPSTIERAELWTFTMALSCLKLPPIFQTDNIDILDDLSDQSRNTPICGLRSKSCSNN